MQKLPRHKQQTDSFTMKDFDALAVFKMHDMDGDGHLSMDEARNLYEDDMLSEKQVTEEIRLVSECVSSKQARSDVPALAPLTHTAHACLHCGPPHLQAYQALDTNKDGKLSKKEYSKYFKHVLKKEEL